MSFRDPLDGSGELFHLSHAFASRGWGIMYRVIDVVHLFGQLAEHDFAGANLCLAIELEDPLSTGEPVRTRVVLEDGRPRVTPPGEAVDHTLRIGPGELAAVLLGVVPLRRFVAYGRARIDDPDGRVDRAFEAREKPVCSTRF